MIRCSTCGGWSPTVASCPNCEAGSVPPARTWVKSVGLAVGGAAVGMTLAACYGSPCAQFGADGECIPPPKPTSATAEACAQRQGAGDPNLAADPLCSEWYKTTRCEDMSKAQDPNLATDSACEEWRYDNAPSGSEGAGAPQARVDF